MNGSSRRPSLISPQAFSLASWLRFHPLISPPLPYGTVHLQHGPSPRPVMSTCSFTTRSPKFGNCLDGPPPSSLLLDSAIPASSSSSKRKPLRTPPFQFLLTAVNSRRLVLRLGMMLAASLYPSGSPDPTYRVRRMPPLVREHGCLARTMQQPTTCLELPYNQNGLRSECLGARQLPSCHTRH